LLKIDVHQIKKLTGDFIPKGIDSEIPAGFCFSTSFPLQIFLATKKIDCQLRRGRAPKLFPDNVIRKVPHFWLQLDSEGTMLDATIRQFNGNAERIYIGKLKDNEVTKKYTMSHLHIDLWFHFAYKTWKESLLPKGDYEKKNILYTLKLATNLNNEIKQMPLGDKFIKHPACKLFFSPIHNFLVIWNKNKMLLESVTNELPNNFDDLLSDVSYILK
jgi:hypothetical protein